MTKRELQEIEIKLALAGCELSNHMDGVPGSLSKFFSYIRDIAEIEGDVLEEAKND
jgi:hypothetical protein